MNTLNTQKSRTKAKGRPSRTPDQIEKSRQLIVAAAKSLFLTEGYQGVTMRKIATKAKCLPATLYAIFPNKRAILYHLWDKVFLNLVQYLHSINQSCTQENRLNSLCTAFVDFWLDHPEDYVAIFTIDDRTPNHKDDNFVLNFNIAERFDILVKAVNEAQSCGKISSSRDPLIVSKIILNCLQGICFNLITIPEFPWGNKELVKTETIKVMLTGLKNIDTDS